MPRFLFTLLFGATILVVIFMMAQAQPDPPVEPAGVRPTWRPTRPTWRPTRPTWRPTRPTWRPTRPTRWPTPPPEYRPARSLTTARPCPRLPQKCTTAGPSLCVRSRNGQLCRRVANKCALRNLNCQSKPRNNWAVTNLKGCCKLKVGQSAVKCREL